MTIKNSKSLCPCSEDDRFQNAFVVLMFSSGTYRGYVAPEARNKLGGPMFETKVFWE